MDKKDGYKYRLGVRQEAEPESVSAMFCPFPVWKALFFKIVSGMLFPVGGGRHGGDLAETAVKDFDVFKAALSGDFFD